MLKKRLKMFKTLAQRELSPGQGQDTTVLDRKICKNKTGGFHFYVKHKPRHGCIGCS